METHAHARSELDQPADSTAAGGEVRQDALAFSFGISIAHLPMDTYPGTNPLCHFPSAGYSRTIALKVSIEETERNYAYSVGKAG
ncbi:hypothetical protein W02_31610 [Nitrospira sp. KM1]|nr:hypothetical protein W02_31610 [Nitrospira sp. KM1]